MPYDWQQHGLRRERYGRRRLFFHSPSILLGRILRILRGM
jgi:hypothetical protein